MAGRIRRGTLAMGGAITGVAKVGWQDSLEFDRSKADNEMHGDPVQMGEGGSGTIELLSGRIASGYATADLVFSYNEVAVAAGVETVTVKTETFKHVTFNGSGDVPAEGKGSISINFEYGQRVST